MKRITEYAASGVSFSIGVIVWFIAAPRGTDRQILSARFPLGSLYKLNNDPVIDAAKRSEPYLPVAGVAHITTRKCASCFLLPLANGQPRCLDSRVVLRDK